MTTKSKRKTIKVTKVCLNCKKPFDVEFKRRNQKFCKVSCKNNYKSLVALNKEKLSWRNKRAVIKRFGYKCFVCHMTEEESTIFHFFSGRSGLIVVQLDKDITDGAIEYIPLCKGCYQNRQINIQVDDEMNYAELLRLRHLENRQLPYTLPWWKS